MGLLKIHNVIPHKSRTTKVQVKLVFNVPVVGLETFWSPMCLKVDVDVFDVAVTI